MSGSDILFLQIVHQNADSDSSALDVEELKIQVGDRLQIVDRQFVVDLLRDEYGNFLIHHSKNIKDNLAAYEELVRTGIIPDGLIHNLCLKDVHLGAILIQIHIPPGAYQNTQNHTENFTRSRNLFVKLDAQMLNTRLRDRKQTFDTTDIYFTPCMFGADSAYLITESGDHLPITSTGRQLVINQPIRGMRCVVDFNVYEREITNRLLSVVNWMVFSGKIDRIVTTLPRGAYYSFLIEAAANKFLTPTIVLEWFAMVDEKVRRMLYLIEKSVRRYNPNISIEQYSLMDSACGVMKAYFLEREEDPTLPIDLNEIFQLTLATVEAADPFVRQAFASGVPRPTNFREFADLTYGLSVLRDMELKDDDERPLKTKQIIAVYDIMEGKAWYASKKYRNQGLLLHRGQFNNRRPQSTTYDHLSYLCVQPIQPIVINLAPDYVERFMSGAASLYNLKMHSLNDMAKRKLIRISRI